MGVFKIGQKVKLRVDVLQRHSRSVPAYAGYTSEQFRWRDMLNSLSGKTGKIQRLFKDSEHVNVQFKNGLIGINKKELIQVNKKRSR